MDYIVAKEKEVFDKAIAAVDINEEHVTSSLDGASIKLLIYKPKGF